MLFRTSMFGTLLINGGKVGCQALCSILLNLFNLFIIHFLLMIRTILDELLSMWIINYSIKNDNVYSENFHYTHWKFTYLSRDLNDLIKRWSIWVSLIYTKRNQQKGVVLKFSTAENILFKGFILRGF